MATKKAEQTTSTALVVTKDSTVPEFIQFLDQQINSMKHIQDSVYKTGKKITMGTGVTLDISVETSVEKLIAAYSGVLARAKSFEAAYDDLSITSYPLIRVDGSTVEEWRSDVQLRIAIINQADKLKELEAMKKEWNDLLDKEDRKAMLQQKMSKFVTPE